MREVFLIGTEPWYERAAMGMHKYETVVECPDEAAFLAATAGRPLVGVERDDASTTIWEAPAPRDLVYLLGSENDGLPRSLLARWSSRRAAGTRRSPSRTGRSTYRGGTS